MAKGVNQKSDFRSCFGTDSGKRVLGWLMIEAGYFDCDLKTTEEIAVQNFVKQILKNMGIYELDIVDSYVQKLFEIPSGD